MKGCVILLLFYRSPVSEPRELSQYEQLQDKLYCQSTGYFASHTANTSSANTEGSCAVAITSESQERDIDAIRTDTQIASEQPLPDSPPPTFEEATKT